MAEIQEPNQGQDALTRAAQSTKPIPVEVLDFVRKHNSIADLVGTEKPEPVTEINLPKGGFDLSIGAKIGIGVGAVVAIAAVVFLVIFLRRK